MKEILKTFIFFILSPVFKRSGNKKFIYITFDDGPHPDNTLKIISILEQYDSKATFFMTGQEMEKYPEIVNQVIKSGNNVGYHSYSHKSMKKQSIKDIVSDLSKGREIATKFNYRLFLYRPPYGDLTLFGFVWLIFSGWKVIMWSKDSRDSFDNIEQVKVNVSSANLNKGEILLFHDDYSLTVNLLADVLSEYKENGIKSALFF